MNKDLILIDIEVIKKEFKQYYDHIEKLRQQAIEDSRTQGLNSSYYEGKQMAYEYVKGYTRDLYKYIVSAQGYEVRRLKRND